MKRSLKRLLSGWLALRLSTSPADARDVRSLAVAGCGDDSLLQGRTLRAFG